jgi:toxin YoeB
MYQIQYTKHSLKQLKSLSKDKKLLLKFEEIIQDIKLNPYSLLYKFESLKHNYSGFYSKRLTKKHRVLYKIEHSLVTVIIVSLLGHYSDS